MGHFPKILLLLFNIFFDSYLNKKGSVDKDNVIPSYPKQSSLFDREVQECLLISSDISILVASFSKSCIILAVFWGSITLFICCIVYNTVSKKDLVY